MVVSPGALPTVSLFNSNILDVNVYLNNGSTNFSIAGTSLDLNFLPQSPLTAPVFSYGGPLPDCIGVGTNTLAITSQSSQQQCRFSLVVPSYLSITSLQIYLFGDMATTVTCVALNAGVMFSKTNGCLDAPAGSP